MTLCGGFWDEGPADRFSKKKKRVSPTARCKRYIYYGTQTVQVQKKGKSWGGGKITQARKVLLNFLLEKKKKKREEGNSSS